MTEDAAHRLAEGGHFRTELGSVRELSLARLPQHESVYAMTVHKSQGSQFETAVVLLPSAASPILTRELLYTAVTRARNELVLVGVLDAGFDVDAAVGAGSGDDCPGTNRSRYARLYGGEPGIDPYTRTVSDVYQHQLLSGLDLIQEIVTTRSVEDVGR